MNEYELLYQIKQNIEANIKANKLFSVTIQDATFAVLEKVGVLFSSFHALPAKQKQEYLKKLAKTNTIEIDEIEFFQESIKWIFRWCTQYCIEDSKVDRKQILADDVYSLMGTAFAYEKFYKMWDFNNAKKVKYIKERNKITFDFVNEDVYKIHVVYDTLFRNINTMKQVKGLDKFNQVKSMDSQELEDFMAQVHQTDYNCSFEIEFEGFNLEEYKIFSTELNKIITKRTIESNKNIRIIIPGEEGIFRYKKEDWVKQLSEKTGFDNKKVIDIIDFFTYDFSKKSDDISLSYFVPQIDNYLIVSEAIFNLSRPETNAMRLLAKKKSSNYDRAQNNFENQEREQIKNNIDLKYLLADNLDKSRKNLPGMDLLVYDNENNQLQIIELKYKIPIESTRDIINLDGNLDEAYSQIEEAKNYTNSKLTSILEEYFGDSYEGIVPDKIDYFVLTNYSVGIGVNANLPTPILLIDHFIELMKKRNGMEYVRLTLMSNEKLFPYKINKRYGRFSILGNKILIPEYSFNIL